MNQPPAPPYYPPPPAPQPKSSNTVVIVVVVGACVLVGIAVIAILAALALPAISAAQQKGQAAQVLVNARQIHQAAYRMVLDNSAAPDPALGWPGDLAESTARPVNSVGDYVERLVQYKYIEREDLSRLFKAPGTPPYPGSGPFDAQYSPFKIYRVTDTDFDTCLFLATRNFTYGAGLDSTVQPFGSKAGVIVRKGGEAQVLTPERAKSPESVGRLPGERSVEVPASVLGM